MNGAHKLEALGLVYWSSGLNSPTNVSPKNQPIPITPQQQMTSRARMIIPTTQPLRRGSSAITVFSLMVCVSSSC